MQKIVVVEDDESLRETIAVMLEREGFSPILAGDGRQGYKEMLAQRPDLLLTDLRLPEMNGVDLCKAVRTAQLSTPIIVLSAIADEIDKVVLLEMGADDYVVKPFGTRELMARIRAVLRRVSPDRQKTLSFGDVEVDMERRLVFKNKEEVRLTPAEYNLLTFFLQNPGRVISRDQILNAVWGYQSYPNTRTVDAHVVKLRQKLEPDPGTPRYLLTMHGFGYRFNPS
jgi:DNA-binding response OmpR family regulator